MWVFADWMQNLSLQQQTVLVLALRGPDGDEKDTVFKMLLRAYRATILKSAKYGRPLLLGECYDTFHDLKYFADTEVWVNIINSFLENNADGAILHHYTHFMHGAEILAYKHSNAFFRTQWYYVYEAFVHRLHVNVETEEQMDKRLGDWGKQYWEPTEVR